MKKFYINVKYGLNPYLYDDEWTTKITSNDFDDEDALIESFRAFYRSIKEERNEG